VAVAVAGGTLITDDGSHGVPLAAGIGLRAPHVDEILTTCPAIPWLEIHPENYLGGGPAGRVLEQIRRDYLLSFHAVGLSLGSVDGVGSRHLKRLQVLAERIEPALISEHLSWSTAGSVYLNYLLPLPYTEESLAVVCRNVDQVQAALGWRILVENPSLSLRFRYSPIPEPEFLNELSRRTGCGLLCDVNNIHVTAHNLGLDPVAYLKTLQPAFVGEVHLAGHARNDADGQTILIDEHGSRVSSDVWHLFSQALAHLGRRPTLIEWDTDIPALEVLLDEARVAERYLTDEPSEHCRAGSVRSRRHSAGRSWAGTSSSPQPRCSVMT
jgi:uncharacterized protein (UPF0276 family)